jgi:ankyrin repeat protein
MGQAKHHYWHYYIQWPIDDDSSEEILKLLFENNASVESRDEWEQTPLLLAARRRKYKAVKFLLEKNADVHSKDKDGMSPLLGAAEAGSIQAVRLLLNNGADATSKTIDGQTALLLAAGSESSDSNALGEILTLLLEETGANIESKDDSGYTSLLMAAEIGNARAVSLLLEKGADINAKDTKERIALSLRPQPIPEQRL